MEVAEQAMEPVDDYAPFLGELVAAIREQSQHAAVVVTPKVPQAGLALGHPRDAAGARFAGTSKTVSWRATSCWAR